MLKITNDSHLDHALTPAHIGWIKSVASAFDGFFAKTLTLPDHLPDLPCALYGPIMGDEPIAGYWGKREGRETISHLVTRPPRPSRQITIIAGPHGDEECVLYTAFGGPLAPKEIADSDTEESRDFWRDHALGVEVS